MEYEVPAGLGNTRLDSVVRELFDVPWSKARAWIQRGKISVDSVVVPELDAVTAPGQIVRYTEDARRIEQAGDFDDDCVVHLDTQIIVASKPSGILTVPFHGGEDSFDKQLRSYLARVTPRQKKRRGALPSLMVVHRLDKGTSGLLVFARTWSAKEALAAQFREHSIARQYVALAHGVVRSQTITSHLLKDRGDGIRGSREHSPNPRLRHSRKGQRAVTHVELVREQGGVSEIRCRLETGRTNQVRIQLSEIGHPILGETTYMRGFDGKEIEAPRLMLHAQKLGFVHPATKKIVTFEQAPPDDFKRA